MANAWDILILQGPDGDWHWARDGIRYHCVAWLRERMWLRHRPFISRGGLYDTEVAVERYENMRAWGVLPPGAHVPGLRPAHA